MPELFPFDVKATIFTVLAVWMTVLSLRAALTAIELLHHGKTTEAQVVDYHRSKRNGIEFSNQVVTFTTSEGQRVRTDLSDSLPGHPIYSERVTVLYDPGHPHRVVKASDGPDYGSVALFGCAAGLFLWLRTRAKRVVSTP
jgi:hypothetical protein